MAQTEAVQSVCLQIYTEACGPRQLLIVRTGAVGGFKAMSFPLSDRFSSEACIKPWISMFCRFPYCSGSFSSCCKWCCMSCSREITVVVHEMKSHLRWSVLTVVSYRLLWSLRNTVLFWCDGHISTCCSEMSTVPRIDVDSVVTKLWPGTNQCDCCLLPIKETKQIKGHIAKVLRLEDISARNSKSVMESNHTYLLFSLVSRRSSYSFSKSAADAGLKFGRGQWNLKIWKGTVK